MAEEKTETLAIRIMPKMKRRIEAAAKRDGMSISDWARTALAYAASKGLFYETGKPARKKRRT